MTIESGNRYYIINKKARTVVDLDTRNYWTVQGWSRHEGTNQQVKCAFVLQVFMLMLPFSHFQVGLHPSRRRLVYPECATGYLPRLRRRGPGRAKDRMPI